MKFLKILVQNFLSLFGFGIHRVGTNIWSHKLSGDLLHQIIFPYATLSPWLSDKDFLDCYGKIRSNTLVDIYRCYELWSIAKQLKTVNGCILEVGVWRGGTGALLASAARLTNQNRNIFLADTFEGVVKAGEQDTAYRGGEHPDTSVDDVLKLLCSLKLENVKILKGIFPEDTSENIEENIALLHCDVDVYESSRDIVEWALPRMNAGSVVVFDDYGFSGCEGVTRYVNELVKRQDDLLFFYNLNGHAILVKR